MKGSHTVMTVLGLAALGVGVYYYFSHRAQSATGHLPLGSQLPGRRYAVPPSNAAGIPPAIAAATSVLPVIVESLGGTSGSGSSAGPTIADVGLNSDTYVGLDAGNVGFA